MLHLRIENPGVCPPEGFTLFGATTKRIASTNKHVIGTFGSGNKHSTCLLLRQGVNPVVYCSHLRMSFYTKPVKITGVANTVEQQQVCVRYGGKDEDGHDRSNEQELSVTLDYGTLDWPSLFLALREYVSNALDACFEMGMSVKQAVKAITVDVVDEKSVRAKTGGGYTRVFVPLTPEVQAFYNNIGRYFLHFSEPDLVDQAILPKNGRNGPDSKRAVIYRRGVFVRDFGSTNSPSLFDYNLVDLKLNESRTASDWDVRHACGVALANAPKEELAAVFRAMRGAEDFWEFSFDTYGLASEYEQQEVIDKRKITWEAAFKAIAGDDGVLMSDDHADITDMVARKGFTPIATKAKAWVEAGERYGLKSDKQVLTEDDKAGRTYSAATPAVLETLNWVWGVVEVLGMTDGKAKPEAICYYEPMKSESQTWGIQKDNKVLIHTDIAGSVTDILRWVVLEEVGHYITGATDMSRDFQTWFIRGWAKLATTLTATVPFKE